MLKSKKINKIIAILLILALCLPFIFACGEKSDNAGEKKDDAEKAGTDAPAGDEKPVDEEPPTDPPAPTEPPTEKPTEPPTERPTDPDNLAANDNGFVPGARYYLWSPNSNLYITCDKWGGLTQEEYVGDADQMFVFEPFELDNGKTAYKIRALGTSDGYYLDTDGGDGTADGSSVIATVDPEAENSHFWTLTKQGKPKGVDALTFSIMSLISKSSKSFDVSGISKDPGARIQVWSGGGADNHKLVFELVADVEQGNIIPRGLQELPESE